MSRTTVLVGSRAYLVSPDDPPPVVWAVVRLRAVDEITGQPAAAARISVREPELVPRSSSDGILGLLTHPADRFPLAYSAAFAVHASIEADRYLVRDVVLPLVRELASAVNVGDTVLTLDTAAAIGDGQRWVIGLPSGVAEDVLVSAAGPGPGQVTLNDPLAQAFPAGTPVAPAPLTPLDAGDVLLHRAATAIRGRVIEFDPLLNVWQPLAGATVEITATWRRLADVTNELAKEPTRAVSLASGLYRERLAGVDDLLPVTIGSVPGDDKLLRNGVLPGSTRIEVSNRVNLAAGSVLRIDADRPDAAEIIAAATVTPAGAVDEPAGVDLVHPLVIGHRAGARVEVVSVTNAPPAKPFQTDGLPRDPLAFVDDIAWGTSPTLAQIGAGPTAEYQRVSLLTATSDADGYFALPPVSRLSQVRIVASAPGKTPVQIDLQPDYTTQENWLDVSFA